MINFCLLVGQHASGGDNFFAANNNNGETNDAEISRIRSVPL